MYYKIIGPAHIDHPDAPPDSAWVDGMRDWALGATVLFIRFTEKHGNDYGAWVKLCELSPKRMKTPAIKLTRVELPYSWLEPLTNYHVIPELPGRVFVGNDGKMVVEVR